MDNAFSYNILANSSYLTEEEKYYLFDPTSPLNVDIEWGKYQIVFHKEVGYRIYRKGDELSSISQDKKSEREKEKKDIKKYNLNLARKITLSKPNKIELYSNNRLNRKIEQSNPDGETRKFKSGYQKFYSENYSRFMHLPFSERSRAISQEWRSK